MTHVPDIIRLEKEAEELETEASRCRWEAAGLMVEELDAGTSQRRLAEEIGKSQSHVRLCAKVWREYLGTRPTDRPDWNTAYQAAKQPTHDYRPAPNPTPWNAARYLLEAQVEYNGMVDSINKVIKFADECDDARPGIGDLLEILVQQANRGYRHVTNDDMAAIPAGPKTNRGVAMLDTVPDDAATPVLRIASALRDIANGDNPERAFLHACQAVTDLAAQ